MNERLLSTLDWVMIGSFLLLSLIIGLVYSKRAGKSTEEYFLSGRKLPWWIAGTAMVATTFAADTPLAVTELVARDGISGNWLWWSMAIGGMMTVFFFAPLWRRAGVLTDLEFTELRYDGPAAAFLRGFRAVYLGLFMNAVIIGWVNLAMVKIVTVVLPGLSPEGFILGAMVFVAIYSSLSGQWGVAVTDTFQFVLAMTGCVVLAWFALDHPSIGGIEGLQSNLLSSTFEMVPRITDTSVSGVLSLSLAAFFTYIGVIWWSSWYPGNEPGGGGYIAQRMMSAKNETHALVSTLWFNIAHYCLRPWPWILVALVSLVMFPGLPESDQGKGFVMVMKEVLPSGWYGFLLAAFLAAYMSTISTHLNWGASYVVNDMLKRFVVPNKSDRRLVWYSRLVTVVIMLISFWMTFTASFDDLDPRQGPAADAPGVAESDQRRAVERAPRADVREHRPRPARPGLRHVEGDVRRPRCALRQRAVVHRGPAVLHPDDPDAARRERPVGDAGQARLRRVEVQGHPEVPGEPAGRGRRARSAPCLHGPQSLQGRGPHARQRLRRTGLLLDRTRPRRRPPRPPRPSTGSTCRC